MNYYPICVKTDYSLLNSLIKVDDLINFLKLNNITHAGICDNNLSGSFEFYKKMINSNLNPIIGYEVTFNDFKIYLYALNEVGFYNLIKINYLNESNLLDKTNLIKYSSNVLCVVPYKSLDLKKEVDFFDYVYFSYETKEELKNLSIITDKVLYLNELKTIDKDIKYLKFLNKLGGTNNLFDNNKITNLDEFDFNTQMEFIKLFKLNLEFNNLYIPKYNNDVNSFSYLKALSKKGLEKRLNNNVTNDYVARLNYELNVINDMGFVDYFLIVYDYVLFAHKENIMVGPGRGSAAGSLVCYSIGITDIDPIKHDLMFERFLNPDRTTLPDIDIDFDSERRMDIINYVKDKYGFNNVAIGLTYNTYKSKLILRDLSKILNVNSNLFESFIKAIPNNMNLLNIKTVPKVKRYLELYPELKDLYAHALNLEGLKKNISHHAAGVIISSEELSNIIPVFSLNDTLTTGITMDYLEDVGLLKMDMLGLKNLTTISNITKKINGFKYNLEDEKTYELFRSLKTEGIFQYETYSMKRVLEQVKPNNFLDLVAAVALVRPGPNKFLGEFVKNKENQDNIKYDHPILRKITEETYGVIIYQEQVIKILNEMGGFSNSESDIIRRAMSQKDESLITESKEKFIKGCLKNNITETLANNIYEKIKRFSEYGFNKSHSVAYALLGFIMGYLKTHYKLEFYEEYLCNNKSISNILNELKESGFIIVKPDINYSADCIYFKEKHIMLPLTYIKGITKTLSEEIVKNKPYEDYYSFLLKNKLSLDSVKLLAKANAFLSLKLNSEEIINNYDLVQNYADLGGNIPKPILKKYEKVDYNELDIFGFYVSNHPSTKYKNVVKLNELENYLFKNINLAVVVNKITKTKTKKGDDMAFIDITDETSESTAIIFSDKINYLNEMNINELYIINGKISKQFDKVRVIINNVKRG